MPVKTLPLRHVDPLDVFERLSSDECMPAYVVTGEWTIITWNPRASLASSSKDCFQQLRSFCSRAQTSHTPSTCPFIGGVLGYITYDAAHLLHRLPLPRQHVGPLIEAHAYDGALLFKKDEMFLVGSLTTASHVQTILARPIPSLMMPPVHWRRDISQPEYRRAFRSVERDIRHGEYYQINLTHQYSALSTCDHHALFCELQRRHAAPAASYFEGKHRTLISLSPESFATVNGSTIQTSPIKGTRPRGGTPKEDRILRDELLQSEKEAAELNMITDLLRNDIGRVSVPGSVRVVASRAIQKNSSVWHTYSTIVGKKLPKLSALDVLIDMFPGGSITGCPKRAAMSAIAREEHQPRGAYTGSLFTLSQDDTLTSSILIRTIVAEGKKLSLGVGGGIVADSVASDEWQETIQKASPFLALTHGATQYFAGDCVLRYDDPRITLFDPSNSRARGVFETLRVEDGTACDLSLHLSRLRMSAKIVGKRLPHSLKKIRAMLTRILTHASASARLKIIVTENDTLFSLTPFTSDSSPGSATFTSFTRSNPLAKSLPYHREWKAHESAVMRGYSEAILVDDEGFVTEGAYSSVFWVRDGVLCTRRDDVLLGITQAKVLALARSLKIPVAIGKVSTKDLLTSEEVFITKSTTGITPIVQVDRQRIGNGTIGTVTTKLITCDL